MLRLSGDFLFELFLCLASGPLCWVHLASINVVVQTGPSFSPFAECLFLVLHLLYSVFRHVMWPLLFVPLAWFGFGDVFIHEI